MNIILAIVILAYTLMSLAHALYYVDVLLDHHNNWCAARGWADCSTNPDRRLAAHKAAWSVVGSVCMVLLSPLWPLTLAVGWGLKAVKHTKPFVADLFYRKKNNDA